jgi:putative hydrolase of the HAD superfamily
MTSRDGAPSTVLFDYGEVLSLPPSPEARAELERLSGAPEADFWAAYWAERRAYDRGCAARDYWDGVAGRLGAAWDSATRHALWATDVGSWLHLAEASAALLDRLAARGTRLALLSNAPHDIAGALRHSPALAPFDRLFFSCDLAACKPEPAVYTHVLTELGTPAADVVFVDDREENVLAAKLLGIDTHHYAGPEGLDAFLTERLGPM